MSPDVSITKVPRTSCLSSFCDQSFRPFPTCIDHPHQRAERTRSMSSNQPFLGVNSSSSCFPSRFQPILAPPYPLHSLPLFDRYSRGESLSLPLEQERYDRLIGSRESNSVIGHELFEEPTQTSVAGFSREQKRKSEQQIPLHTHSNCSSSCYLDSERKKYNHPTNKKSRKVNTPEELKDDKYWDKRRRNNLAAKKSRDAKRSQNLSAMRKGIRLEIENTRLRFELSSLREENKRLKRLLCQPY